ncbi:MAG: flippase [Spirochaetaceae bacterium]
MKTVLYKYKKYILNSGWLLLEKILSVVLGFTVGIITIRYLGPERLGALSYVLSIISFCSPLVHLGLNGLLQRELIDNPENHNKILFTVIVMKLIVGVICVTVICLFSFFYDFKDERISKLLPIVSVTLLFAPITGVSGSWFRSQILAKYSVFSNGALIITNSFFKVIGVVSKFSLVFFAILEVLSKFISALVSSLLFKKVSSIKFSRKDFDFKLVKTLLKESKWIIFSAFSSIIYIKIDQIMLGNILGLETLGIYSSSVRLSEQIYFIPSILMASLYPLLIKSKKESKKLYMKHLQFCFDLMFSISCLLAIIIMFSAGFIIQLLYGDEFSGADKILSIHIFSGIFVFWGIVSSKWLILEKHSRFILIRSIAGAIVNIILNIVLIPNYGGIGAAIATLIAYGFTHFILFMFYKKTKEICFLMLKSIFFIPRYIYKKIQSIKSNQIK